MKNQQCERCEKVTRMTNRELQMHKSMSRKTSSDQIPKVILSAWLNKLIELKNIYILYVHLICWVGRDKRDFSHEPFLNSDRHITNNQGTFLRQEEIKDPRNKVGSSFPWRDLITIFNKMFHLRHYGSKIFYDMYVSWLFQTLWHNPEVYSCNYSAFNFRSELLIMENKSIF